MRILAIAGSLRRDSHNRQLLRRAAELLPEGVELDWFEQLRTSMFGAVWAQADTRKVLGAIGARVVDAELPVARAHEALGEHDRLLERDHHDGLTEIVDRLVEEARARRLDVAA